MMKKITIETILSSFNKQVAQLDKLSQLKVEEVTKTRDTISDLEKNLKESEEVVRKADALSKRIKEFMEV